MKDIELTQGKVALVDDEDYEYLKQSKWYAHNQRDGECYAMGGRGKIYMHRLIMGTPKGMYTDHINGNGLDNRKENLRVCTNAQNLMNRPKSKINTTGYKGVTISKYRDRINTYIRAQININGKNKFLGFHKTPELAAKAYNKAAIKYHGEFAQLNEIC